ncbi:hypothetical protein GCM10028805_43130 [Spirosoma harenae]
MKTLLVCLMLLTCSTGWSQSTPASQPLDILLIGTAHQYGKNLVEHFDYPLSKALAFRPDAVFGEDLAPQDYDALPDFWNKAALEKRVAYIRSHPYPDPQPADQFIQQTYALLRKRPDSHQERMRLARALFLIHDFGNARYQLYQLDKFQSSFDSQHHTAYRAILGEPDSLYRSRSSEYHNIFFPLLDQLKQDRILPMDSQQYDLRWQAAWNSLSDKLERAVAAEKDSNSANYRVWTSFLQWQHTFRLAEDQIQQAGQTTRSSNTDLYSARVDSVNFGGDRLLQHLSGFPAAEAAQMRHYWQLRNEAMCQNIVNRARAIKARRVVVGVGSAHRKTMIDILRAMPNVTVYTLNEYQPERPAQK